MSRPNIVRKVASIACGTEFSQRMIEKRIKSFQRSAGIGAGGSVRNSGEFAVLKKVSNLPGPEYCIFDVGANKGDFTELVLSSFKNDVSFSVHCFEPSRTAFEALAHKLHKNPHAVLNNLGLGKEKGEFDLFADSPGSGGASLTRRNLAHLGVDFAHSEKVQIDRIDNYCSVKRIQHIDLLKIDVEGHELDVLQGAQDMFDKERIKMVSFEFGGCNIDTRTFFQDFYYFFNHRNFRLHRITPSGYLYPIPFYSEFYEQFRTTNFLAVNAKHL